MNSNDLLRDRALLKITHQMTLNEIFDLCDQDQNFRDACSLSEYFWKQTMHRHFGGIVITQRGDLIGGERWEEFVQGVAMGIVYRYGLDLSDFEGTQEDILMMPYASTWDPDQIRPVDIIGQLPLPDTKGYAYALRVNENTVVHHKDKSEFFVHPNREEAFKLCLADVCDTIAHTVYSSGTIVRTDNRGNFRELIVTHDQHVEQLEDDEIEGEVISEVNAAQLYEDLLSYREPSGKLHHVFEIIGNPAIRMIGSPVRKVRIEFNVDIVPIVF